MRVLALTPNKTVRGPVRPSMLVGSLLSLQKVRSGSIELIIGCPIFNYRYNWIQFLVCGCPTKVTQRMRKSARKMPAVSAQLCKDS